MCAILFNPNNSEIGIFTPHHQCQLLIGHELSEEEGVTNNHSRQGHFCWQGGSYDLLSAALLAAEGWVHGLGERGLEWAPAGSTVIPFCGGEMRIRAFMWLYYVHISDNGKPDPKSDCLIPSQFLFLPCHSWFTEGSWRSSCEFIWTSYELIS